MDRLIRTNAFGWSFLDVEGLTFSNRLETGLGKVNQFSLGLLELLLDFLLDLLSNGAGLAETGEFHLARLSTDGFVSVWAAFDDFFSDANFILRFEFANLLVRVGLTSLTRFVLGRFGVGFVRFGRGGGR